MSEQRKLRVGVVTSSILVKTGFSNNIRCLLPYLYQTGKYELFHLNQCIDDNDPNLKRFPWKNAGVFRKGEFDEARFNNPAEEPMRRSISYGNAAIERFILENKLDILLLIEDPWAFSLESYIKSKWYPHLKQNTLLWTTADSLPILPDIKTWAENCHNVWFWADFAERVLKEENIEKYGHVKTLYGAIDTSEYTPLSKEEKSQWRKKFNLDDDTKIFIQLGRNQLRKLYPQTLESFAEFKKQNPNQKAKLLFHCSWSDGGGWPLEKLRDDFKVSNEDVLTTYFCRQCGEWEIKAFQGEEKPCKCCGMANSQITAGINSTITNKEVSIIYGICDASVSPYTSGGYEFHNIQSLLCGLPLLCSEYSSGETFVAQPFVFKLDGNYTFEAQTGFKKFAPFITTMTNFYKRICELSEDERLEIGRLGRDWAIKNFSYQIIGKQLEKWLDNQKAIEWDYTYPEVEPKNPFAEIPPIQDNTEWVRRLYKDILKMTVDDNDPGLQSWVTRLSGGQPRAEIESYFRKVADEENKKNPKTIDFGDLLEKNDKKRILLTIPESAGDVYMSTSLYESIRNRYPAETHDFYVATKPQFHDILLGNPYVTKVLHYTPEMDNTLLFEGMGSIRGYFDVVYPIHLLSQRMIAYTHGGVDSHDIILHKTV
jgi:glycosyltransferase involved in cell wall biosynthesis